MHPSLILSAVLLLALTTPFRAQTATAASNEHPSVPSLGADLRKTSRTVVPEEEAASARIPGFASDIRFHGNDPMGYGQALTAAVSFKPWLALSGGGQDGAFGAGVMTGWTEAGTRPDFALVTGVSAGALLAPYAYLGSTYDHEMRDAYLSLTAADVFEVGDGGKGESLLDTWPLAESIKKRVTPRLLEAVAVAHAGGRLLWIVTTDLDAGKPVVWDLGAIAARGGPEALALFRQVLLASSSIPGLFPPVEIAAVTRDGQQITEMHVDGATTVPFYVAPETVMRGCFGLTPCPVANDHAEVKPSVLFTIVNGTLGMDYKLTERNLSSILGRAISIIEKTSTRASLAATAEFVRRQRIPAAVAAVKSEDATHVPNRARTFDPAEMSAMFELGRKRARAGQAFIQTEGTPDFDFHNIVKSFQENGQK